MVTRIKSKRSKYHGTRTCGAGNTKNRRGKGDRGGVGRGGRKHRFIFRVINEESIKKKGFEPWRRTKLDEADLDRVSKKINEAKEDILLRIFPLNIRIDACKNVNFMASLLKPFLEVHDGCNNTINSRKIAICIKSYIYTFH